mmetsp:Transcript_27593/g.57348  ORF Transcript_27593/g.57348 Transcript_27593/m.57348 type:complete len:204 (+) Transcript_27593:646-1257(+)
MLDNFLSCFPVAWQDLLLFVNAAPNCLTLGKCHLHRPKVTLVRYENSLFMKLLNSTLRLLQRPHAHKGTTDAALCLRCNDKHFQHVAKLLEALLDHLLVNLPRQAAYEEFHASLLAVNARAPVHGCCSSRPVATRRTSAHPSRRPPATRLPAAPVRSAPGAAPGSTAAHRCSIARRRAAPWRRGAAPRRRGSAGTWRRAAPSK